MTAKSTELLVHLASVFGITGIFGFCSTATFVAFTFKSDSADTNLEARATAIRTWTQTHTIVTAGIAISAILIIVSGTLMDRACGRLGTNIQINRVCNVQNRAQIPVITTTVDLINKLTSGGD